MQFNEKCSCLNRNEKKPLCAMPSSWSTLINVMKWQTRLKQNEKKICSIHKTVLLILLWFNDLHVSPAFFCAHSMCFSLYMFVCAGCCCSFRCKNTSVSFFNDANVFFISFVIMWHFTNSILTVKIHLNFYWKCTVHLLRSANFSNHNNNDEQKNSNKKKPNVHTKRRICGKNVNQYNFSSNYIQPRYTFETEHRLTIASMHCL